MKRELLALVGLALLLARRPGRALGAGPRERPRRRTDGRPAEAAARRRPQPDQKPDEEVHPQGRGHGRERLQGRVDADRRPGHDERRDGPDSSRASPPRTMADLLRTVPGMNVIQTSARDINLTDARRRPPRSRTRSSCSLDGRSVYLDFFGLVLWDFVPEPTLGRHQADRGGARSGVGRLGRQRPQRRHQHHHQDAARERGLRRRARRRALQPRRRLARGRRRRLPVRTATSRSRTPSTTRWSYRLTAGYFNSDPYSRPTGTIPLDCHPFGVSPCRDCERHGRVGRRPDRRRALPGRRESARQLPEQRHEPAEGRRCASTRTSTDSGGRITYEGGYAGTDGHHPHRHRPVRHPERLVHGLRQGRLHARARCASARSRTSWTRTRRTCCSPIPTTRPADPARTSRPRPTTSRSATRTCSAASTS